MATKWKFGDFAVQVEGKPGRWRCRLCDPESEAGHKDYGHSTLYRHFSAVHRPTTITEEQQPDSEAEDDDLGELLADVLPEPIAEPTATHSQAPGGLDALDDSVLSQTPDNSQQQPVEHGEGSPPEHSLEAGEPVNEMLAAMEHQAQTQADGEDTEQYSDDSSEDLDGLLRTLEVRSKKSSAGLTECH